MGTIVIYWLKTLFAWRPAHDTGAWIYLENTITGRRKAYPRGHANHQPVNRRWLDGGEWEADRPTPPPPWTIRNDPAPPLPYGPRDRAEPAPRGCICPPGSEATCRGALCPRQSITIR